MCFSVASRTSLENIKAKWYPEVSHFCPDTPIVLVGTKIDLRGDDSKHSGSRPLVTYEEGAKVAKDIGKFDFQLALPKQTARVTAWCL